MPCTGLTSVSFGGTTESTAQAPAGKDQGAGSRWPEETHTSGCRCLLPNLEHKPLQAGRTRWEPWSRPPCQQHCTWV